MNRAIYPFAIALVTAPMLTFAIITTGASQSVPPVNRITPSQRQQFARDLVPSDAQDFFNTGRDTLEQEIRRLTQPRSLLKETLLTVHQETQRQPKDFLEKPSPLQRDQAQ